jgi:hypothetical protein
VFYGSIGNWSELINPLHSKPEIVENTGTRQSIDKSV